VFPAAISDQGRDGENVLPCRGGSPGLPVPQFLQLYIVWRNDLPKIAELEGIFPGLYRTIRCWWLLPDRALITALGSRYFVAEGLADDESTAHQCRVTGKSRRT
jgi:hypothetical protein